MDEAATLFLQQGFDGTSLRHIADAAGMKAGSLYYHFSSKNDLLEAILRRGLQVMVDAFEAADDATRGADGRTRIEAHIRAHLAALYENGPYTAAHVTTFRTAPAAVCEAIVPARDAYEARWTALLEDLVATGELVRLNGIAGSYGFLALEGRVRSAMEKRVPRAVWRILPAPAKTCRLTKNGMRVSTIRWNSSSRPTR